MNKYRVRTYGLEMVATFDLKADSEPSAIDNARKIIPSSYFSNVEVINFDDVTSDPWDSEYRRSCPWQEGRLWLSSPHDNVKVVLNKSQIARISEGLNYYRKFLGRLPIKEIAEKAGLPVEYIYQLGFYANDKYRRD